MGKYNLSWADIKRMDGLHPEDRNPPGLLKKISVGVAIVAVMYCGVIVLFSH